MKVRLKIKFIQAGHLSKNNSYAIVGYYHNRLRCVAVQGSTRCCIILSSSLTSISTPTSQRVRHQNHSVVWASPPSGDANSHVSVSGLPRINLALLHYNWTDGFILTRHVTCHKLFLSQLFYVLLL